MSVLIPRLNWAFHAFYGHYYQAPPLHRCRGRCSNSSPGRIGDSFRCTGSAMRSISSASRFPTAGGSLDADNFQTRANKLFRPQQRGQFQYLFSADDSTGAFIRGWEVTLRSPRLWNRGQFHLAYSNQIAEGEGTITGGLTDFSPPSGYFPSTTTSETHSTPDLTPLCPWDTFASTNVYYGSGSRTASSIPQLRRTSSLPGHTTIYLVAGPTFRLEFLGNGHGAQRHEWPFADRQ